MQVKTLGDVDVVHAPGTYTYSVHSSVLSFPTENQETRCPAELDCFLEGENPLGCIRGVMWVMVFNAAAFLLGLALWESVRHIW